MYNKSLNITIHTNFRVFNFIVDIYHHSLHYFIIMSFIRFNFFVYDGKIIVNIIAIKIYLFTIIMVIVFIKDISTVIISKNFMYKNKQNI